MKALRRLFGTISGLGSRATSDSSSRALDQTAPHLELPRQLGDYELTQRIECGPFAVTYEARDLRSNAPVFYVHVGAVLADAPEQLLEPLALLVEHSHPNLLPVRETGNASDGLWYTTARYQSTVFDCLREVRRSHGPVALDRVVSIGRDAARGLHTVHELGVHHGLVWPEHLCFDDTGSVRVGGWGDRELRMFALQTKPGVLLDKVQVMAPEQATGERSDNRSDVYCLAALLSHLATGVRPFGGETELAILKAIAAGQVQNLEILGQRSSSLSAVLKKALSRDPAERFDDAEGFALALEACGVLNGH